MEARLWLNTPEGRNSGVFPSARASTPTPAYQTEGFHLRVLEYDRLG